MKNTPLLILILGLITIIVILIGSSPVVQDDLSDLLGLTGNYSKTQKVLGADSEIAKVARVIDGDTIELSDGRRIRYLNADTPETKKPSTPIQCFGPEASKYNKDLVEGKTVQLIADKRKQDRYGRDLRFIFLDGVDSTKIENSVNAKLVRSGFARTIIIKPNNTYEKVFREWEYEAKEQKIGIWNSCPKPFEE